MGYYLFFIQDYCNTGNTVNLLLPQTKIYLHTCGESKVLAIFLENSINITEQINELAHSRPTNLVQLPVNEE